MFYDIISTRGHYEAYAPDGSFLFSADTQSEAEKELELWRNERIA